jgi:hypothetical protein
MINEVEARPLRIAFNASVQTGAIWGADTFGSPVVQSYLEGWLDAKFGLDSSDANTSGNRKNCGN